MKNKNKLLMILIAGVFLASCTDIGGEKEPPAGNQKLPVAIDTSAKLMAEFNFEKGDFTDVGDTIKAVPYTLDGGSAPEIVESDDTTHGKKILHLKGGYLSIPNPMKGGLADVTGFSVTMWVKMPTADLTSALVSMIGTSNDSIYFTGNDCLKYEGSGYLEVNNPNYVKTGDLTDSEWHSVGFSITTSGFQIFLDGILKYDINNHLSLNSGVTRASGFDYSNVAATVTSAPYIYIGVGGPTQLNEAYYGDIKIFKNAITVKDIPANTNVLPAPVWENTFENGLIDCSIVGSGKLTKDADSHFGEVFQNVGGAQRTNYLLLPSNVLSHSADSKELSIGVWVNATNAGGSSAYSWAPLFEAYGAAPANGTNTWPMLSCEYRGVVQVNCAGWCDFTDAQNVKGANALYHDAQDWLSDNKWHYYTAVFTATDAKVYLDGTLANEWKVDGVSDGSVISGLFTAGNTLTYICLGGNQAWNWGDNDLGAAFDDIAIYNTALTASQIESIIAKKLAD